MKNIGRVLWGIILVAVGIILVMNAFNVTDIDIFFEGWWTVFIIVPCVVGIFTERDKLGNIIGAAIGVMLLLCCQDILSFDIIWKLVIPVIIIIFGLKLIFGGFALRRVIKINVKTGDAQCSAVFSGKDVNFDGIEFTGADLSAIFGGVDCDVSKAIITSDACINASAIFGGIDIIVPKGANVKISSVSVFGGVTEETHREKIDNAPTIFINATCIFGGIDVK